jgi:hypothetical protein
MKYELISPAKAFVNAVACDVMLAVLEDPRVKDAKSESDIDPFTNEAMTTAKEKLLVVFTEEELIQLYMDTICGQVAKRLHMLIQTGNVMVGHERCMIDVHARIDRLVEETRRTYQDMKAYEAILPVSVAS